MLIFGRFLGAFWEALQNDKARRRLCRTNWYAGTEHLFGGGPPGFSGAAATSGIAPPLFGFDNEMDQFCQNQGGKSDSDNYIQRCVSAGYNQLSLLRTLEPYNLCRNVEYQVCAARGLIQSTDGTLVFASRPGLLDPRPFSLRGLGWCGGPMPESYRNESCAKQHWGNDDIFFLEACVFHLVCRNADELPSLQVGQPWRCDFSENRLHGLRILLTNLTRELRLLAP